MPITSCAVGRLLAAAAVCLPLTAAAMTFQVSIDTTPLAGQSGYMAFDLYQGAVGTVNDALVTAFNTPSLLGSFSSTGDVVGNLQTSLTLRSTVFFSEFLQAVAFGTGVTTFQLDLTNNHVVGNIPDSLALFLLNSSFIPYATSDPTGAGALATLDLVTPLAPAVYTSNFAVATVTPVTVVPEPGAALMMGVGILGVLMGTRRSVLRVPASRAARAG